MGSENARGCTQNTENGLGIEFFDRYHKYSNEFLNNIVTGDETQISFMNAETTEQSKQWMHTHSPIKPKSLNKHCLP
jgi:hypothetical protein